nr:hypothetical protein JVH1_6850 [Rhodococcus sp. JVH1]
MLFPEPTQDHLGAGKCSACSIPTPTIPSVHPAAQHYAHAQAICRTDHPPRGPAPALGE